VIIGATATSLLDFHAAPFAPSWLYPDRMSGVEIQANAIATLLENRAIALGIPNRGMQGLFVLILVAGAGVLLARPQRVLLDLSTRWQFQLLGQRLAISASFTLS
jgi:CHASE2 domain-containing sensor protein